MGVNTPVNQHEYLKDDTGSGPGYTRGHAYIRPAEWKSGPVALGQHRKEYAF